MRSTGNNPLAAKENEMFDKKKGVHLTVELDSSVFPDEPEKHTEASLMTLMGMRHAMALPGELLEAIFVPDKAFQADCLLNNGEALVVTGRKDCHMSNGEALVKVGQASSVIACKISLYDKDKGIIFFEARFRRRRKELGYFLTAFDLGGKQGNTALKIH